MEKTITVHLVDEKKIKELNKKHRNVDRATDVLSFPLMEHGKLETGQDGDWGDVFLCLPKIKKQAKEYKVSFEEEFSRMLTHGILHLLGFDHQKKTETEKMFKLQEKIVKKLCK